MDLREIEERERNRFRLSGFIGAFLAIITVFLISPLFYESFYAYLIVQVSFIFLILSTICSINHEKAISIPGLLLCMLFIYFDFLSVYEYSIFYMLIAYGIYISFTIMAIIILIKRVFTAPVIDTNLIFGALIIYLLAGVLWAKIFLVVDVLMPGSFQFNNIPHVNEYRFQEAYDLQFNLLYFSFTTLATLGLGDVIPVQQLAKSLTALQAMFGQLFVATVIAKLVSVWRHQTVDENSNKS